MCRPADPLGRAGERSAVRNGSDTAGGAGLGPVGSGTWSAIARIRQRRQRRRSRGAVLPSGQDLTRHRLVPRVKIRSPAFTGRWLSADELAALANRGRACIGRQLAGTGIRWPDGTTCSRRVMADAVGVESERTPSACSRVASWVNRSPGRAPASDALGPGVSPGHAAEGEPAEGADWVGRPG